MEPGTDRRALETAWQRIEQRRREGTLLATGTALVLAGVLALFLWASLPTRLCSQGAGYGGCFTSAPSPGVQAVLLAGGLVAGFLGVLAYRRAYTPPE